MIRLRLSWSKSSMRRIWPGWWKKKLVTPAGHRSGLGSPRHKLPAERCRQGEYGTLSRLASACDPAPA
jgi:hypothetical protein